LNRIRGFAPKPSAPSFRKEKGYSLNVNQILFLISENPRKRSIFGEVVLPVSLFIKQ